MIKKALIVAAGKSSRLYPRTLELPKGLLKVGDTELLLRSVNILKKNGIEKIGLVVGFQHQKYAEFFKNDPAIELIINPFYEQCNNAGSLWMGKNFIDEDPFIYLHGDMIYEPEILVDSIQSSDKKNSLIDLIVDFSIEVDEEAMKVDMDENFIFKESSKEIPLDKSKGEWIGIAFINQPQKVFNQIEKDLFEENLNIYDTFSFTKLANQNETIRCIDTQKRDWVEVDFEEDYQRAISLFN